MVVLHARNAFKLGGAELYYPALLKQLREQGVESIMVTQQPELITLLHQEHFRVAQVPWMMNSSGRGYLLQGPLSIVRYWLLILKYGVHILNLSGRDAQVFGTIAAKSLGRKAVWTDHGDLKLVLSYTEKWQAKALRLAAHLVDHVIFVSHAERELVLKSFPNLLSKSSVIHNGIDANRFKSRGEAKHPVVFSNARIQTEKGFEDLVVAMQAILKTHPEAKLAVGAGIEEDDLLKLAEEKLGSSFEYLGFLTPDQVARQLACCWVYVFPSRNEVFPLSIVEAKLAGAPIVATGIGGIPEMITNGQTGILVPPQQPDALAQAIRGLLDDQNERQRLSTKARDQAMQESDLRIIVRKQIIPLYNGLL